MDFCKNISKNLSGKYSQKFLIMLNSLLQMHLKLVQKRAIQKTAKASSDLIGTKIAELQMRIIKKYMVSKGLSSPP